MDAHKIAVKLFVEDDSFLTEGEFVPIFHSWIQNQIVPDHTLIDVTDYAHAHEGPGTVLIAQEANIYADRLGGRLGLTYSRKQPSAGSLADRLRQAITAALQSAARLETDPRLEGRIKFKTDELLITLNDRLHAPNTTDTFRAIEGDVRTALADLYGNSELRLDHQTSNRDLFQVHVHLTSHPAPSR